MVLQAQTGVDIRIVGRALLDLFFPCGLARVSWSSKKDSVIALSSCEKERILLLQWGPAKLFWLDTLVQELKMKKESAIELFVDNKSAINLTKHPVTHGRCKHFVFLRDQVNKEKLKPSYCKTEEETTDIFTKLITEN